MPLFLDKSIEKNNLKMPSFIQQILSLSSLSSSQLPSLISDRQRFQDQVANGLEQTERLKQIKKKW